MDEMFKNEKCKIVYLLTKVDGEKRNEELGLTKELYENEELAKKWYDHISEVLNSNSYNEECEKLTTEAFKRLDSFMLFDK